MLKPSPKTCVEHTKSDLSHYPDPDVFLHSSDLSPLCPPLLVILIFLFFIWIYSHRLTVSNIHHNYLLLSTTVMQPHLDSNYPANLCWWIPRLQNYKNPAFFKPKLAPHVWWPQIVVEICTFITYVHIFQLSMAIIMLPLVLFVSTYIICSLLVHILI